MDTLKEAFFSKYPGNTKIVGYFEEANGCECTWENLTKVRLQKYVNYLLEHVAPNSAKTYCAKFKAILTAYNEEVTLPKDYDKVLQVRKDASQHVYLNNDEITLLRNYVPKMESEHIIKNWFLIGCLTGARHSDYIRFTQDNIIDDNLKYLSIKTHTDTSVPLAPYAKSLIVENMELGYNNAVISDSYFNRSIRRMFRNMGLNSKVSIYYHGRFRTDEKWRFISSHTARRSFATNLYKAGVDIYTISRLCGHSSVEMTKKYICCPAEISDRAREFFDSFSI